jgi:hypothetical protein
MLTHTPYDGSATPFTIGLSQLDVTNWIEPDGDLQAYLAEKHRLLSAYCDEIFRVEPGMEDACQEVLDLLGAYLPQRHPDIYRTIGRLIEIEGASAVPLDDEATPALQRAGLLVQDDLVIMHRGETGWRIAAAFVAFPSSWSLEEKFGRVMDDVHADVPGFQGGSRNAELINRMFDRLQPERSVERMNWSINWSNDLYTPKPKTERTIPDLPPSGSFIRVERQTLRRLPISGDILFTIRIYLDPILALRSHPRKADLMRSMASQLEALTPEQVAYKGLGRHRDALIRMLSTEAGKV